MDDQHFLGWDNSSQPLHQLDLQGIMPSHDCFPAPTSMDTDSTALLDLQLDLTDIARSQTSFPLPSSYPHIVPQPTAPAPEYQSYPVFRRPCDQDAWNPFRALVSPPTATFQPMPPHLSSSYAAYQQNAPPSDSGSLYKGFRTSDSGYGTHSSATRSVTASSYVIDRSCSPKLTSHHESESVEGLDSSPVQDQLKSSQEVIKCDYPNCTWTGKCPSDRKKHEARHKKLFKCTEPNCNRKEGFGTVNDLARHKKCVHKQEPTRGPKVVYKCFAYDCPRKDKMWPRLDNFKQHLGRMHSPNDVERLLKKSEEWYLEYSKTQSGPGIDRLSHDELAIFETKLRDFGEVTKGFLPDPVTTGQSVTSPELLQSPESLDADAIPLHSDCADWAFAAECSPPSQLLQKISPAQLAALHSFCLQRPSGQPTPKPVPFNAQTDGTETMVAEAAESVINAMKRIMSSSQRRQSQQTDEGVDMADMNSDLHGQLLHQIFSTARDQLSSNETSRVVSRAALDLEREVEREGWQKCKYCSKVTRLQCEMKKHQKRHERPYGCTFCDKTFGSKADWKRHEHSQHKGQQGWGCDLQDSNQYRLLLLQERLDDGIKTVRNANQLGQNGRLRFWCGFCQKVLPVQGRDIQGRDTDTAAWDERLEHIDSQHFKKGQRKNEWLAPPGHPVKKQDPEIEAHAEDTSEDDDCSSRSGDEEINYEGSRAFDITMSAGINSLKRKCSAVEPSPLNNLGENKKRVSDFENLQPAKATDTVTYPKCSPSLELGPETVSCCQCRNGLGDMTQCLFRPHTPCEGCHGMAFSGPGCAWSNT